MQIELGTSYEIDARKVVFFETPTPIFASYVAPEIHNQMSLFTNTHFQNVSF